MQVKKRKSFPKQLLDKMPVGQAVNINTLAEDLAATYAKVWVAMDRLVKQGLVIKVKNHSGLRKRIR